MEKNWGILTRIDGNVASLPIKLCKNKYLFGRADACDFKFDNNFLSQKHCFIEKDKNGNVNLVDQSSNGTLVNLKKKIHMNKTPLKNQDDIYLVYRQNEKFKNIIFKFESIEDDSIKSDEIVSKNVKNDSHTSNKRELESNEETKNIKLAKKEPNDCVEKKESSNGNEITENITCTICNDIMHDCISLQPCLHSYCAACYSDWMDKSEICPICRNKVERISKNHLINNIIEAFLKDNPHKKRSEEEIKQMNEKNKIKNDMLFPIKNDKINKYEDDYESDDDDDLKKNVNNNENNYPDTDSDRGSIFRSDNEEEDEDEYIDQQLNNYRYPVFANNFLPNQYFHAPVFNNQAFRFTCRQCPQNKYLNQALLAPDYTCTPYQNHLLCQCCLEAFPDRNHEIHRNPLLPKQSCSMCLMSYCNLYWGCNKGGCKKCLIKFKDFEPEIECLDLIINDNKYESQLFSDWIVRTNKNVQDIFNECVTKLKNGTYKLNIVNNNDSLDKVVCRKCAFSLFKELAYQFRNEIPKNAFFNNDNNQRPDCYWGRECRTQKHNNEHSK